MPMIPLCCKASSMAWRKVSGSAATGDGDDGSLEAPHAKEHPKTQAPSASTRPLRKARLGLRCTGLRDISRRVPPAEAEQLLLVQLIEGLPGAAETGSQRERGLVFGRGFRLV